MLPRIVFLHIGKTGGANLHRALSACYPEADRAPHVAGVRRPDPATLRPFRYVGGHFGYSYAAEIGGAMVTVLRNPVDRILSLYSFWRNTPARQRILRDMTLAEFVTDGEEAIIGSVVNTQTWFCAADPATRIRWRMARVPEDELLGMAKAHLDEFAVVGVTDRMDALQQDIEAVFGLKIDLGKHRNRTKDRTRAEDVPPDVIALIEERTHLDRQLYEYALSRQRIAA